MAVKAKKIRRAASSVDLTEGPIFKRMVLFTLPIIATGVLQLLFNTADLVVVGNSTDPTALGAVGATGPLINLIVNLLLGLSVGAGVCAANYFGSRDEKSMHELVHTAFPTAAIGGVLFGIVGFFGAREFLILMDTTEELLDKATLYVEIYSIGIPVSIVYNFGAAILRSVGDTTRPLIFLVISGVVNVIFNLIFVFCFGMDVDGVAIATVISQALSAFFVVGYMMRVKEGYRFEPRKMRFYKDKFLRMLVIGLPAGIQGSFFSISNIIIQASINPFGSVVVSGNTSAANIEGYVYVGMNAFHQTALNFTGQHIGAKKYHRIKKITFLCVACVSVVGLVLGLGVLALGHPLLNLYSPGREDIIEIGMLRLKMICVTYFTFGVADVLSGILRGMGHSASSMFITLGCVCGLRILWVFTIFKVEAYHTLEVLFYSYPISWIANMVLQAALLAFVYFRLMKRVKKEESGAEPEKGAELQSEEGVAEIFPAAEEITSAEEDKAQSIDVSEENRRNLKESSEFD